MKAIRIYQTGGPEVMKLDDVTIGKPGAGSILIRNKAIGVNYTDVYVRTGQFMPDALPFTPGKEAAGEVIEIGEGVTDFKPGDRVAYVETPGAYAEFSIVPEHFVVHLPDSVSYITAAASMLKGLTAYFLSHKTFKISFGHTVLIHAAAGGVGSILTQWAKKAGATVIGTVGSAEKMAVAKANGCDHVINYNEENFVEEIDKLTDGERCHVVYDSVGKATYQGSLDCLRPFGYFINFGFTSGAVPPLDLRILAEKGSLFATWPGLTMYLNERSDVLTMSEALFSAIGSETIRIAPPRVMPLEHAAEAHLLLESRSVFSSLVLVC
ncbi:quinone oxidoreductase family protein [Yersinia enterocolitica]|uniref:quinone oxidoreductase family protein n=1 Tax=Yersinia enterocolitica TaxID=630 RepID=UPI000ACADB4A|nr:quinone oxidoreductase [Yersinia enterocolitica]HEN3604153.1 quinone oxidoreductase [Yersinia enterocolitica]HEN3613154.1 quinone oxidoreductase [Yersinia enterocolitica]